MLAEDLTNMGRFMLDGEKADIGVKHVLSIKTPRAPVCLVPG
jgi:hypothetical protein